MRRSSQKSAHHLCETLSCYWLLGGGQDLVVDEAVDLAAGRIAIKAADGLLELFSEQAENTLDADIAGEAERVLAPLDYFALALLAHAGGAAVAVRHVRSRK